MNLNLSHSFKMVRCLFVFIIVAGCNEPSAKKQGLSKTIGIDRLSVRNMQADLSILWSAIKELHPAYGIYTPADSMRRVYNQTMIALDTPQTEGDFVDHVYPLLSKLRCGHTQLRHSAGYRNAAGPVLPFGVLVQNHRAWVTTHQTTDLNTGDEILSINDVPVASIINHGADLYAGDGYNETFKELFLSEYDGFEDACNKYYHWAAPYHITLRTNKGIVKTINADMPSPCTPKPEPAKAVDNYTGWTVAKNTDYLPLRFLKNSPTAWFEVHSYQYNDTIIFKEAFKQIHEKGIKNLIIDLRHNTGGDIRIGAKLLTYLADSPFAMVGDVRSRIPNPAINHFEKYFDTARTASFNQSFKPTGVKKGDYYHVDFKPVFGNLLGITPLNKTDHFNGNLIVLIDGATFSAGAHSAIAIKTYCKNASFVGRETAGGAEGCSGGTIQNLTLPNTHVIVEFPLLRFVSVAKYPALGHGIMPDYAVIYKPEDVVDKADLDIKKALSLIK